tara:strand:+ start:304 stop:585 length:282 start_codon:yes stop_codon:yes gene_type:complete
MAFKMKGSSFLKDVKMYDGNGNQITVDDTNLGKTYKDENGNEARDYKYIKDGKEGIDVLYLKPPRGPSEWENKKPIQRSVDPGIGFGENPNLT